MFIVVFDFTKECIMCQYKYINAHVYNCIEKKSHYKSYGTCKCCVKTKWKTTLNMYIILDQAGNVTDTQYCFIRSSLTWDDGKVFLLTRFLHLFSGSGTF